LHIRNLHGERNPHQNGAMRIQVKLPIAALLCGVGVGVSWAQEGHPQSGISSSIRQGANRNRGRQTDRTLSPDDRLSVIAAALDSKVRPYSGRDCSHLVHTIYKRAGFPYAYASSSDLYVGVEGFERVAQPQPGDLVVWRGHVGIVIRPSRHVFFSFMHGGPGIDDYEAPYWTHRGHPRFYRYVKNNPHARSVHSRLSD
jgi:cell wall-associated NlpC family hydrolase